ncbi:DUF742 domain-containing protein [Streptomyces lavendulae]|uniref:DUF742 domain-containing protein n=1 Tax=Streptomyces lavendulae TaxID=1914 RepID=UPI003815F175
MPRRTADPAASAAPAPLAPRPYALTTGRTVARPELRLEALVLTTPGTDVERAATTGHPELDRILALCSAPASVAEVSARLDVPLGATRVLLSDLWGMGRISVVALSDGHPSPELMERVLSGLHGI